MERNENGTPIPEGRTVADNGRSAPKNTRQPQGTNGTTGGLVRGGCLGTQNGDENIATDLDGLPLAYAYVPWQKWRMLYKPENALGRGTLFEELDKPLGVYGYE